MRTAFIAAALLVPAAAHADQRIWSPARFDRVASSGSFDVTVVPGPVASVRAEGDSEAVARMRVTVENGGLEIGSEHGWHMGGWHLGRVHVTVTAPVPLRAASLAGSGNLRVARVDAAEFEGHVAGSGDLLLDNVAVRTISLSIAGSGNVRASGHADHLSASVAGSGNAQLRDLHAAEMTGNIAGSGNIEAFANRSATLSIMGSGDARVRGGARCTVSKMGSGSGVCTA